MANRMILNETAWFGRGAVGALTDEVIRRGYRKALIVTDANPVQCGVVEKVTSRMDAAAGVGDLLRRYPQSHHCSGTGRAGCL